MRQRVLFCIFTALLMTSGPSHGQQAGHTYPSRQVRMVVPYPAGGPTDLIGRLLAQKLGEQLGQSFYVENIAGASGALGAGQVAQAAADGHTLLVVTNDFAVASVASSKLPYDPVKSFSPVTIVATSPQVVAGQPNGARQEYEGADRSDQGRAGQVQLRWTGDRLWPAVCGALVQARPEAGRACARSFQRSSAGGQLDAGGAYADHLPRPAPGRSASGLRQAHGHRRHQSHALAGFSGNSDLARIRSTGPGNPSCSSVSLRRPALRRMSSRFSSNGFAGSLPCPM